MAILKDTQINGNLSIGGGTVADFIVERVINDNNWYIVWNSGWKECGGIHSTTNSANNTIEFPITFTKVCSLTTGYLSEGSRDNPALIVTSSTTLSTTGFTCINKAGSGFTGITYRAEGY